MSIWDAYPITYRQAETAALLAAVEAGECAALVGLSGSGKSNLLGFLAHRAASRVPRRLVDCNRLEDGTPGAFFRLVLHALGQPGPGGIAELEAALAGCLKQPPGQLALVLDRFDAIPTASLPAVHGNLRALRDEHKYALSLVTGTRRPPDPASELAELFFAHTIYLGPLSGADARWSAAQFAARRGLEWGQPVLDCLVALSGGYPSFLRAACEAHAAGVALEPGPILRSAPIQRRLEEFWADQPSPQILALSNLTHNPLLAQPSSQALDTNGLTASELRLLEHLQGRAGEICSKDELARAVWPEDRVFGDGIRDDSLAQLVRRLREKIELDPSAPKRVVTVPGRGYKFI